MQGERANVIHVDFRARCRHDGVPGGDGVERLLPEPLAALVSASSFLVFWRAADRPQRAEYLGGRWNRGWVLFVWTREDELATGWYALARERGYVAERLERDGFRELLLRCGDVVGLIVNGDIDPETRTIRAAPEQMVPRDETLKLLRG
jgi:hypothetical protein